MAQLELSRTSGCGVLTVHGSISSRDATHLLVDALAFVPENEHLVVDLRGVTELTADTGRCAADCR